MDATKDYGEWRKLLAKAGVRQLSLHAARHTCASELISRGVNPKTVQEQLGHASPAYTLSTYVQSDFLLPGVIEEAVWPHMRLID